MCGIRTRLHKLLAQFFAELYLSSDRSCVQSFSHPSHALPVADTGPVRSTTEKKKLTAQFHKQASPSLCVPDCLVLAASTWSIRRHRLRLKSVWVADLQQSLVLLRVFPCEPNKARWFSSVPSATTKHHIITTTQFFAQKEPGLAVATFDRCCLPAPSCSSLPYSLQSCGNPLQLHTTRGTIRSSTTRLPSHLAHPPPQLHKASPVVQATAPTTRCLLLLCHSAPPSPVTQASTQSPSAIVE